jgi:hypothetical protein
LSQCSRSETQTYVIWGSVVIIALALIGACTYLAGATTRSWGLFAAPTPTPLPAPVVNIQNIKAQAELSTVEMSTVTEIYRENAGEGLLDEFFQTQETLLMLVYGEVNAGFDLNQLEPDDLWIDGDRVRLVLPAPQILNTTIDFDRTHVVYYDSSLLLDDIDPNLQGAALGQAQQAIEAAALQEGILERANQYGKLYYENWLYSLGFTDVEVVVDGQMMGK